jgi:hypothetical protein
MIEKSAVYALLEQAFREVRRPDAPHSDFSPALKLLGADGIFDSLDAMLFLDKVEELLLSQMGREGVLSLDDAFFRKDSPFRSMESLADHLCELLNGEGA